MSNATWAVPNFLGGEISQFAQGRFDRPDYKVSLNVCLNSFPTESGSWTRRPGTRHAGTTRAGAAGRTVKFDVEQANALTFEFTSGYMRVRAGLTLVKTHDPQVVAAISAANPAVLQIVGTASWQTGKTIIFDNPGPAAVLENRQFTLTRIDASHFGLADAITGTAINGATLGAITTGGGVQGVAELATPYVGASIYDIRIVQADATGISLAPGAPPQVVSAITEGANPLFQMQAALFNDGPYLDPLTNGAQLTPSAKQGIVNLTLSFATYDATKVYKLSDFVTSGGVNYTSLIDQNVGNNPAASPADWAAAPAGLAVNDGLGFLGSDTGRLIRLLSEPAAWLTGSVYAIGAVVSYNPSGLPGATTYWSSLTAGNTGHIPGIDIINWQLISTGFLWTWGRITGLSNIIDRALAGSTSIGGMTTGGGLAAAFDGVFSKNAAASARQITSGGFIGFGATVSLSSYVGKDYSGATDQAIMQATVYPSSDIGIGRADLDVGGIPSTFTINLRGKSSLPASSSDGTLLGTSGPITATTTAITIVSSDQVTAWKYVWIEVINVATIPSVVFYSSYSVQNEIAQVSFFNPTGSGTGQGVSVEILGPALLYTATISTWRLGVYSDTTGYPTCGCWDGGRLWLGGAVNNRWDASYSNGLSGNTVNFAPTNQFGVVSTANAISYTFNADTVNPIFWMSPELQGVVMGTQAGEFLVQAPTAGPLAANNVSARRVTKIGCANVEPVRTEHTTVFVKRYARKLMEYFADVYSGKYSAPNLADKAQHITSPGVAEIKYTEAVNPILWGRDDAGALFGVTYKRDSLSSAQGPTFYAWHRHALGSGRSVESMCTGPSVGGDLDTLTMVTNDAATGVRHVEILTDTPDELTTLAASWFLDDAVNPSSVTSSAVAVAGAPFGGATINGLWHLNGKTVQVFAAGLDCGDLGDNTGTFTDYVVANGSVFVPFGDGFLSGPGQGLFTQEFLGTISTSQIVVGFTYNSDGQLVRRNDPGETGARNGPAMGKKRRNHRYALQLINARGVSVGCRFSALYPALFRQEDDTTPIGTLTMFTGIHQDALEDDYSYDGMFCWRVARPMPATVAAVAINTATQDQ